jgi:hypothetical protein
VSQRQALLRREPGQPKNIIGVGEAGMTLA